MLVAGRASAQLLTIFGYDEAGNLLSVRQTDMRTDPSNCGSPGKVCSGDPHGAAVCAASACTVECSPGYLLGANLACGSVSSRGVQFLFVPFDEFLIPIPKLAAGSYYCGDAFVQPTSDPDNCGGCGFSCPAVSHGARTCVAGACGFTCAAGYSECNGACVRFGSDVNNCGQCGRSCPTVANGVPICYDDLCGINCNAGYEQCSDGCVSLATDRNNCGSCGRVCPAGMSCGNGSCVIKLP